VLFSIQALTLAAKIVAGSKWGCPTSAWRLRRGSLEKSGFPVTLSLRAHPIQAAEMCRRKFHTTNIGGFMKKAIGRLMAMCFLTVSLAAFAQSGDAMKQDDTKKDDGMKHDQTKNDEMKKDKKSKKTKKAKMKKDDMKKDDNMKHDDGMKQN
jgi:pentapeptide MXKDX repeat protein